MSCFAGKTLKEERIDDVLEASKTLLELGGDALQFSPIPGLDVAAGALSTLIGMVQQTRGNVETKEELAQQIQILTTTIQKVHEKSKDAVDQSLPDMRDKVKSHLHTSLELKERVDALVKALQSIGEDAEKLGKHGFFLRCLRSNQDAEALTGFRDRLKSATELFMLGSQATVEKVVNDVATNVVEIREKVTRLEVNMKLSNDEITLRRLVTVEASYREEHNKTKSHYLKGTRNAVLEDLDKWAQGDSDMSQYAIYVLSGVAGTGKSTIAYEFARRLEEKGLLGATFFFVRGSEKLSTARFVLPTIAYQLARTQSDLFPHIVQAAQEHIKLGQHQQLEFQLEDLIIKPLKEASADHTPVIAIIDAVDECKASAQDEVARLLYVLMEKIQDLTFPLRILITTRPELNIENALYSYELRKAAKPFKLHDIPRASVDSDITQYLEDGFIRFRYKEQVITKRPNAISDLTKAAEGLFIYASTALDFIFKNVDHPDQAVRNLDALLLDTGLVTGTQLDKLYLIVLSGAFPDVVLERQNYTIWLRDVLGAIALLQDHVSPKTLESLIGIQISNTLSILSRLGSVMIVPDDPDGEMRPLHASFPQFLIDKARCTNLTFYIDPLSYHGRLALHCLTLLNAPRTLRPHNKNVASHIQYSCVHWSTHLSYSESSLELYELLDKFLKEILLLWFEALSYIGRLDIAAPALLRVRTWYQGQSGTDDLSTTQTLALLNDGYRFILEYFEPIKADPKHIYISALPLTPSCTLRDIYGSRNSNESAVHATTERDSQWGPCLRAMEGHTERVECARFSPDGRYIVSAASDNTVRTWDAGSGVVLNIMRGHEDGVNAVDFSPDPKNRQIVSGSDDTTLRIWDFASGAPLHKMRAKRGNVFAVAYSPDGKRILSGSYRSALHLWNAADGKLLGRTGESIGCTNAVAFSRDGSLAVTGDSDSEVRIWHGWNGEFIKSLGGHTDQVKDVAFMHDGKRVVSGASDNTVRVWDVDRGSCLKVLEGHTGRVFSVAVSAKLIASGSGDSDPTIRLWDVDSHELLAVMKGHSSWVLSLSFSPDGSQLVSASDDKTVRLWDVSERKKGTTVGHEYAVNSVAFSEDGVLVATGSDDKIDAIWETKTGKRLRVLTGHTESLSTGKRLRVLTGHTESLSTVAFSPDRRRLASAGEDNTLRIWDVESGELWKSLSGHTKGIEAVAYSPDGLWLASGANTLEPSIRIWRASDGTLERIIVVDFNGEPIDMIETLEFSPDSSKLHTQTINGLTYIWNVSTGDVLDQSDHEWELASAKAAFKEEDGWITSTKTNAKLCWLTGSKRTRTDRTFACHGNYYAVGAGSGQFTILDLSELVD